MATQLFPGDSKLSGDHRWYSNLARPDCSFPDVRDWCDWAYAKFGHQLDPDFPVRFRRETPHRYSELFFATAFYEAGWEPTERVTGFDLSYQVPEGGRLLVEIVTPDPQSRDTWTEIQRGPFILTRADENSMDAALRRLTSAFYSKAQRIRRRVEQGQIDQRDFVIIAISGLRLKQETEATPSISGEVPDFLRAFLPIGGLRLQIPFSEDAANTEVGRSYEYSGAISQEGKNPVDRDAFIKDQFRYIDAVAYSPVAILAESEKRCQVGLLHNPRGKHAASRRRLQMGAEYYVTIGENEFSFTRSAAPEACRHHWDQ